MLKIFFISIVFILILSNYSIAIILHDNLEAVNHPLNSVIGKFNNNTGCVAIASDWIVSTIHQGGTVGSIITINEKSYIIDYFCDISVDIKVSHIKNIDNSQANLENFASISNNINQFIGKQIVISGYGSSKGDGLYTNNILYGYKWENNSKLRWGTNTIDTIQEYYINCDFDEMETENECAIGSGDSGGGWFAIENSKWVLIGISKGSEHFNESWFRNKTIPTEDDPDKIIAINISRELPKINSIMEQYKRDIIINLSLDYNWCYENYSKTTNYKNKSILKIELLQDNLINYTYNIYITKSKFSNGDGKIQSTSNAWKFDIVGLTKGNLIISIIVEGIENGGIGFAETEILIRPIGDVNGNGYVNASDKLEINKVLNGLQTLYNTRELDFNGDGSVTAEDKFIINKILNGIKIE